MTFFFLKEKDDIVMD